MRLFIVAFCVSDDQSVTTEELAKTLKKVMVKVSKLANCWIESTHFLNRHPNPVLTLKRLTGTLI